LLITFTHFNVSILLTQSLALRGRRGRRKFSPSALASFGAQALAEFDYRFVAFEFAGLHAQREYALFKAISPSHRIAGAQRSNAIDRCTSAQGAALFEQTPQFKKERDERRSDKIAGCRRRQDGDSDKLIGCPATLAGNDSAQAGDKRGDTDYQCGKAPAKLSYLRLVGHEAHH